MTEPLSCYQCGKNLLAWAASDMFCNQDCQRLWYSANPFTPRVTVEDISAFAEACGFPLNGWQKELMVTAYNVPTEPAGSLEVLVDAPTPVAPGPGYLPRVLRRLFG